MDKSVLITMRHEEKYICSEKMMFILENRLRSFLPNDSNQSGADYNIRSVYFDTVNDKMLSESLQGVERRDKFRIRIYNHSRGVSKLEKKTSIQRLKTKQSVILDAEEVEKIIAGEDIELDSYDGLKGELYYLQKAEGLKPKIIVEYDRSAYVYDIGNVRITFDKNIKASTEIGDFYTPNLIGINVMPDGMGIMEVKYDGILPGFISKILNIGDLQQISFSKYGLCRNIVENNGRIDEIYEF